MDSVSQYYCHVCCKTFKKFIIFEGHLAFNNKCRENLDSYMQCYLCRNKYNNFAALKYHLRSHKNGSSEKRHAKTVRKDGTLAKLHLVEQVEHSKIHSDIANVDGNHGKIRKEADRHQSDFRCKICHAKGRSKRQLGKYELGMV